MSLRQRWSIWRWMSVATLLNPKFRWYERLLIWFPMTRLVLHPQVQCEESRTRLCLSTPAGDYWEIAV